MDDSRKHNRMPVNLSCKLRRKGDPSPVQVTVLDVSFGGMGVIAPVDLGVGAIVEFQHRDFPCATASDSVSTCRVVSTRPAKGCVCGFRTSLAFETTDAKFARELLQWAQMQTLVRKRAQERPGPSRSRWV